MKECLYYTKLNDGQVRCELCPHYCQIKAGSRGLCRSRVNHDGRLFSEVYGQPCSLAIDPIEKKPLYHFHPGSECLSVACTGCNLRCKGCQNYEISQVRPEDVESYQLMPNQLVELAKKHHQDIIAYTYTEPLTWYEYTLDCCRLAHENGLKNVLVSAGYINEQPLLQLAPFINAANIDLKFFTEDAYRQMSGATLQPVLNTLKLLHDNHVWLEITHLMIPGTETEAEFRSICQWLVENGFADSPLHLSRFFPRYKLQDTHEPTPKSSLIKAKEIAEAEGIIKVYLGNV